jgi:hypothetical protein
MQKLLFLPLLQKAIISKKNVGFNSRIINPALMRKDENIGQRGTYKKNKHKKQPQQSQL